MKGKSKVLNLRFFFYLDFFILPLAGAFLILLIFQIPTKDAINSLTIWGLNVWIPLVVIFRAVYDLRKRGVDLRSPKTFENLMWRVGLPLMLVYYPIMFVLTGIFIETPPLPALVFGALITFSLCGLYALLTYLKS